MSVRCGRPDRCPDVASGGRRRELDIALARNRTAGSRGSSGRGRQIIKRPRPAGFRRGPLLLVRVLLPVHRLLLAATLGISALGISLLGTLGTAAPSHADPSPDPTPPTQTEAPPPLPQWPPCGLGGACSPRCYPPWLPPPAPGEEPPTFPEPWPPFGLGGTRFAPCPAPDPLPPGPPYPPPPPAPQPWPPCGVGGQCWPGGQLPPGWY